MIQIGKNVISMKTCIILIISLFAFMELKAQDDTEQKTEQSSDDLAKQLANPNATLGVLFTQFDYSRYSGDVPDAGQNGVVFNFQPSLPIPLGTGVNLFVRPLIPVYLSQPVSGTDGFSSKAGLGNISADVALGKTWPSKWMTMIGVFAGFRTASIEELKAKYTTLGPEVIIGKTTNFGFLGIMVNHGFGVGSGGDPGTESFNIMQDAFVTSTAGVPRKSSVTAGQYFYIVGLKNGWQIAGTPTFAINHNAEKGSKLTLPLGTGVVKVTKFGNLPVKLALQYWYYAASPEAFGPKHLVRLQIAPVIPLPW
ncbi:MAG: hypothetical protein HWE09_10375 [Cyclobacteriaceae bacterium]|uniref:hypothetical protein n=1 Tax=Algoriphagus sp. TaxID=1872435 RepID=UPI0018556F28|nr:hypothetical protein [Algoriphagus sp.]NVJ85763.1 hypothetical protein [Algoriphagus sp.]NVK50166.1 hypothetical protein [Cyclobacteriaceae bacterium]